MSQSEYGDESFTAGWFIWLVRLCLIAGTALGLWGSTILQSHVVDRPDLSPDASSFWRMVGLLLIAGFAFCVAVRIPFPRPRMAWGRVVFVAVGLVPAVHWWLVWSVEPASPAFLHQALWFDELPVVQVAAALAGVGLASAIGARRGKR
jgi:hypothetical protein